MNAATPVTHAAPAPATIPWWRTACGEEEIAKVVASMRAEHISGGPVTRELEEAIAKTLGVPYVVATTSCSMALTMALMTLGIGPGDEVIVPNRTFMATAHAALVLGAKVRLVDVRKDIPALDVTQVEAAITPRTKAVMPVHLNGRAVDMPALNAIARRHNLKVVEDAAQAFLSKGPDGAWLGTQGDLGCFSLGMTKLVSTGQGGFVVTRDKSLYDRMRRVQVHGVVDTLTDAYEMLGSNFKFNDVLASIGVIQLQRGADKVAHVTRVYETYRQELDRLSLLEIIPVMVVAGEVPLWTEVCVAGRSDQDCAEERARLMAFLAERGIQTRRFLPDLDRSPYLGNDNGKYPNSRRFDAGGMFLPGGPAQPMANVHRTIEALHEYRQSRRRAA